MGYRTRRRLRHIDENTAVLARQSKLDNATPEQRALMLDRERKVNHYATLFVVVFMAAVAVSMVVTAIGAALR